jgi:hypothetical protein
MTLETHWHKRVPLDMAREYIAKGWQFYRSENQFVLLIWPHEGAPT